MSIGPPNDTYCTLCLSTFYLTINYKPFYFAPSINTALRPYPCVTLHVRYHKHQVPTSRCPSSLISLNSLSITPLKHHSVFHVKLYMIRYTYATPASSRQPTRLHYIGPFVHDQPFCCAAQKRSTDEDSDRQG